MADKNTLLNIRKELIKRSSRKVKIDMHDIDKSFLEGCFSRGDRTLSEVVYSAWKKGAKMDSWSDFFNISIWEEAFKENGLIIEEVAGRRYAVEEALPWGHIDSGIKLEHLSKELTESGF